MKRFLSLVYFTIAVFSLHAQTTTPPTSFMVAKDGSGNFKTIQEAINAVRDLTQVQFKIFIKNGTYNEKLIIPSWKTHISLIGESRENTIITNGDYTGKDFPGKDASGKDKFMTFTTYTLLVQGNDCEVLNVTIQNTAGRVGQAVALHVEGDRIIIKNCRLLGNQDTLYVATSNSRQYFEDCYIEGTTDFVFGEATVVFQNCTIRSLLDSYVTASASSLTQTFGFVFFNCKLIADSSVKKVFLGRPWRPYAKTVFIHCELGSHILPEGWNPWKGDIMFPDKEKTAYYAEYGSSGPGSATKNRVSWSKQLTGKEMQQYNLKNILGGKDGWNPVAN